MDIDFIKYSLEDKSIRDFIKELNNTEDDIKIKIIGKIEPLHHQDYDGKRVYIQLTDKNKYTISSKLDIGVHKYFDMEQDEYYFDLNIIDESVSLLINSKEQILLLEVILNMDDENIIEISPENIEIIDNKDYKTDINDCFTNVPKVAQSLINNAKSSLKKIEQLLYTTPSFVNMIKSSIPEVSYQAILDNTQKEKIAKGAVKLMTKKDGSLMANLVDTKTNKIVDTISLKDVNVAPEITQAISTFSTQMQMAQIAEQIQFIQFAVEEVRQGQAYDRLATAYSCQQKLLQIMEIKNNELKNTALLNLVSSAEDSRNLLMQSQSANLSYIKEQPQNYIGKFLNGSKQGAISKRMNAIRESLNAVNMVSLVEAIAYQEMGETSASKLSLQYYADYISKTYLNDKSLVERLDLIDPSPTNYWTENLPIINNKIHELSDEKELLLNKGDGNDEENK